MNARQARMRVELKKLLKRGMPAAKAMKLAWKRTPKNPRRLRARNPDRRCKKCGGPTLYRSGVCRWCQEKEGRKPGPNPRRLTRTKARKILHHGTVRGRPLTEAQRRLFGAKASGYRLTEHPELNPPPIRVYANDRLIGQIGFRPTKGRRVARNPRIDIRV
jgi:hypothetical protein